MLKPVTITQVSADTSTTADAAYTRFVIQKKQKSDRIRQLKLQGLPLKHLGFELGVGYSVIATKSGVVVRPDPESMRKCVKQDCRQTLILTESDLGDLIRSTNLLVVCRAGEVFICDGSTTLSKLGLTRLQKSDKLGIRYTAKPRTVKPRTMNPPKKQSVSERLSVAQLKAIAQSSAINKVVCQQYKVARHNRDAVKPTTGPGAIIGATSYSILRVFHQERIQKAGQLFKCRISKLGIQTDLLREMGFEFGTKVKVTQVDGGIIIVPGDSLDKLTVTRGCNGKRFNPKIVIASRNLGELRDEASLLVVYGKKGIFVTKSSVNPTIFGLTDEDRLTKQAGIGDGLQCAPMAMVINRKRPTSIAYRGGGVWMSTLNLSQSSPYSLEKIRDGAFAVKEVENSGCVKFYKGCKELRVGATALKRFPELIGKQLFLHKENNSVILTALSTEELQEPALALAA